MKPRSPTFKDFPLVIAGSDTFGRYPKISVSRTFNLIVSDNWLVTYAGFSVAIADINPVGKGRGIYKSSRYNLLFLVIGNGLYTVTTNLLASLIGQLNTFTGDVFFAEDNNGNVAICDKVDIWIYNASPPVGQAIFQKATMSGGAFVPGWITFHDSRFISVDLATGEWRLSDPLGLTPGTFPNTNFPFDAQHVGQFQTKADKALAVFGIPGKGNNIIILGSIVGQYWTDVGGALFPYQRNAGINIDYGLANADTIADLDNYVSWLGINDRSGPVIMISKGGSVEHISNDGIDFKLASLQHPEDSHGFMFKQDGHIFYQLTFPSDNYTLAFDFNTGRFYSITDAYMNYHPAKGVAFFNETYYFVSLNDGSLYEMSTNDTTYAGLEIPRVRVCDTIRLPDTSPFVVNNLTFPIEQGVDGSQYNSNVPQVYGPNILITENGSYLITENGVILTTEPGVTINNGTSIASQNPPLPAVDLSISIDGGYSFSNFERMILNPIGLHRNRFIYYNLGWCNEFTPQFRFFSQGRFVCGNGSLSIYQ